MLVAIHQPHYLPWLGYLQRMARADLFIVLDHVQFERGNYQNRTQVRVNGAMAEAPAGTVAVKSNVPVPPTQVFATVIVAALVFVNTHSTTSASLIWTFAVLSPASKLFVPPAAIMMSTKAGSSRARG